MKKKTVKKMFLKHIEEQITNGLETIEGGLQVLSGVAVFPDQFSLMVDDSSSSIKQGIGLYKEGGKKRNKGLTEEGIRMVAEAVSQLKKGRDFLKSTLGIDNVFSGTARTMTSLTSRRTCTMVMDFILRE